ncbi:MAG: DUF4169 domain-containing protein [Sphingomonas sp. 28-66-16]|nr:MAG: DUF4169 domain-containing protein [Sphingomonas sp. 28-66-16]
MAGVVNLRAARKAKARADATIAAANNRALFGRTKAEKQAAANAGARHDAVLDGAKRER